MRQGRANRVSRRDRLHVGRDTGEPGNQGYRPDGVHGSGECFVLATLPRVIHGHRETWGPGNRETWSRVIPRSRAAILEGSANRKVAKTQVSRETGVPGNRDARQQSHKQSMASLGIWAMDTGKHGGRDNGKHVAGPNGNEGKAGTVSRGGETTVGRDTWKPGDMDVCSQMPLSPMRKQWNQGACEQGYRWTGARRCCAGSKSAWLGSSKNEANEAKEEDFAAY